MSKVSLLLAGWTILAGIGIPLIGILNAGMAKAVGGPIGATAIVFAVACLAALLLAVMIGGLPTPAGLRAAPGPSWLAGLLIGFYALSATVIIPRFGAGNFVGFILLAQLVTAAAIDQWGLLGMARQSAGVAKLAGFALILGGLALVQFAGRRA